MAGNFRYLCCYLVLIILTADVTSYEKTLRKIVRNQSKMVQTPFSKQNVPSVKRNSSIRFNEALFFSDIERIKNIYLEAQRPKESTILPSLEGNRSRPTFSKVIMVNPPSDRLSRNSYLPVNVTLRLPTVKKDDKKTYPQNKHVYFSEANNMTVKNFYKIPSSSRYFPAIDEHDSSENTVVIPDNQDAGKDNGHIQVKGILIPQTRVVVKNDDDVVEHPDVYEKHTVIDVDPETEAADFMIGRPPYNKKFSYHLNVEQFTCVMIKNTKTDINAQVKFSQFNIEPYWMTKKQYWDRIFDRRYESLMRNAKWPPLKVLLLPHVHIASIWKKTFEQYHEEHASKILYNLVKKLQFYERLTFSWHEVSHLSHWWKSAPYKTRSAFRKLLKEGRLEITTGSWVQTDEATTHLFGLVHQMIEGQQWLKLHLNYTPKVAWLTSSVSHSPTMAYLLSISDIHNLVITNLHYSWERFLAEYQYSEFLWLQNWDQETASPSKLNDELSKMGQARHPQHSVLTHFLQFNTDGFGACGPKTTSCNSEYNFANPDRNLDITLYNIKDKAEKLLEQYSKAGTISQHNTIIAPLGEASQYEVQSSFDFQYNNYMRIAEFVNANKDIYKATVDFGTTQDYFNSITEKHKDYPTIKGDFLNFADISCGSPAYWTGYFTSRPFTKILLRRLEATLRSTEILFSFALSHNVFRGYNLTEHFEILIRARETTARLLDRNVVSGTVSATALKYVHDQILKTVKDCWYLQEVSASFLTLKPEKSTAYLKKYVYREGDFISVFRSVAPGDQIYIFNSLSHERTEIVEIVTRYPNIRVVDHNKKDLTIQVNPVWKYNSENLIKLSRRFFKISFAVMVPPMTLALFKILETYDGTQNAAAIYCLACVVDETKSESTAFPFSISPIQSGDIQLESYKHRLIFDEGTGFLKTVVEKKTNIERTVFIDYGAFRDSSYNSGMYLFNTNVSKPLQDMLTSYRLGKKQKMILIVSGQVTTELITIYGRLLQHTTKVFNLLNSPLSNAIYVESKVDYEVSPKNRELEMFLSIQTDIGNGNPPRIFTDNNSYQYTSRILNISRRIESNMYPITSMAFIQDSKSRLSLITDHAQGVTALQEGQLVVMLDRRVLFSDDRGTNEGLADSSATCHKHFILLENFIDTSTPGFGHLSAVDELTLPSLNAIYLANSLNYFLDIFFIEKTHSDLCFYLFMPLIRTAFPCDVSVINFRLIFKHHNLRHYVPTSALLILHRQSFSCHVMSSLSLHCHTDSNFSIEKLLRNVKSVYRTNLAGTTDIEAVLSFNLVNFAPMELISLRIDF